ncbi:hypothetical protein [Gimesia aquarii]|uniref:Uncharacterized protein n=1 Tax=Gimesia aquarii TaxID=2527964 RepID=A0A517W2F7_9PLAN|nr:hypothetical protein [Gimesia aquarii]QDT99417.1 hypothetical protein V144x_49280 [Gimesia aquarii]
MSLWVRNSIVVASLFLIFSSEADAHLFRRLFDQCGTRCYYPQHKRCGHRCRKLARRFFRRCAPVTSCCPGVCMPPPPKICYQDIICTEYRMVPQTRTVPVTTYQQVTVDEGCWQRVWVPRMVTKQIPRTEYRRETSYVRTPYQVRRRVPVMSPQPSCPGCLGTQPSIMNSTPTLQPQIVPSTPSTTPAPLTVPNPTPMSSTSLDLGTTPTLAPTLAARPTAVWGGSPNPVSVSAGPALPPNPAVLQIPQAAQANSEWQVIQSQNAYLKTQSTVTPQTAAYDEYSPRPSASAKGAFVPAPSAATVWNTPRRRKLH